MEVGKWIKRIAAAGLSAGTSLLIACAYGTYYSLDEMVYGRVTHNGEGIEGIQVCATVGSHVAQCTESDANGDYLVEADEGIVDQAGEDGFILEVNDVDGPANGLFQNRTDPVQPGSMPVRVDVELTEVTP